MSTAQRANAPIRILKDLQLRYIEAQVKSQDSRKFSSSDRASSRTEFPRSQRFP